jgi:hypothetical protein
MRGTPADGVARRERAVALSPEYGGCGGRLEHMAVRHGSQADEMSISSSGKTVWLYEVNALESSRDNDHPGWDGVALDSG